MKIKVNLRLSPIEKELELTLETNSTVEKLLERLVSIYGQRLRRLTGDSEKGYQVLVMRSRQILPYDEPLKDGDDLAIVLPLAGG